MGDRPPVVVGAGPAGIRAAATLAAAGLAPIVIDEAPAERRPDLSPRLRHGFTRPLSRRSTVSRRRRRAALHEAFDGLGGSIDYRPGTLVWDLRHGALHCLSGGRSVQVPYRDVILAPGARDRIIPFPGWTLPGVYTLGGAQIALKHQGCAVGARIVFMGTGPLLYLVAYQYAKAGAEVAAVLDTVAVRRKTPRPARPAARRSGRSPRACGTWRHCAPAASSWQAASGRSRPRGRTPRSPRFVYRDAAGTERRLACDAIAFGFGLSSETQLADLAEVPFAWDPLQQQFLPERDIAGRTPVPGVYLAGDGSGIAGADAAELGGERAALALLEDRGHRRRQAAAGGARARAAADRRAPGRPRDRVPLSGRHRRRHVRRDHPLPLRGRHRGRVSTRGGRAPGRRDQSRQGVQPLRHGALPGTRLRAGRRRRAGGGARRADREHRQAAQPAAGQAHSDGGAFMSAPGRIATRLAACGFAGGLRMMHAPAREPAPLRASPDPFAGPARDRAHHYGCRDRRRRHRRLLDGTASALARRVGRPARTRAVRRPGERRQLRRRAPAGPRARRIAARATLARDVGPARRDRRQRLRVRGDRPHQAGALRRRHGGARSLSGGRSPVRARARIARSRSTAEALSVARRGRGRRLALRRGRRGQPAARRARLRPRRAGRRRRHPRARAGDDDRARRHAISACARQAVSRSAPERW